MRTVDRSPVTSRPGSSRLVSRRRHALVGSALGLALTLGACAGGVVPPGGGTGAGSLPTSDDVLGLPADAFNALDRSPDEAVAGLGSLTPRDVAALEQDAVGADELAIAVRPGYIRVHYSDDTSAPGEFFEAEEWEWVVHTTDGADLGTTAFTGIGEAGRHPLTSPVSPEVPDEVLAAWEVSAAEAAEVATGVLAGEVEQVGVPDGVDRPLTTVVLRDGTRRTRVTVDAVTGEALNVVHID